MIFIDHGSHHRWVEIEAFRDKCDIMVIHDADAHLKGGVNPMGNTRPSFKYSIEIPALITAKPPAPSTIVASMTHDLSKYNWS